MKTAISLPDNVYFSADKMAKQMGIPRSQLFAIALIEYIKKHKKDNVTAQLNKIYPLSSKEEDDAYLNASLHQLRKAAKDDAW